MKKTITKTGMGAMHDRPMFMVGSKKFRDTYLKLIEPPIKSKRKRLEYSQIFSAGIKVNGKQAKMYAMIAERYADEQLRLNFKFWLALYPGIKLCLFCRKNNKNTHGLKIHFAKQHLKMPLDLRD